MNNKLNLAIKMAKQSVLNSEKELKKRQESFDNLNKEIQKGYIPNWSSAHGDLIVAKQKLDHALELLGLLTYIADDSKE